MPENKAKQPQLESDPRFPSGQWKGFWLQRGVPGRQWMALSLEFRDGNINGEGRDWVGDFLFTGRYALETGKCALIKTYIGSHSVSYEGANEDDGKWLWGVWKLPTESGGFHLWPKGEEDPTQQRRSTSKKLPVEKDRKKAAVTVEAASSLARSRE